MHEGPDIAAARPSACKSVVNTTQSCSFIMLNSNHPVRGVTDAAFGPRKLSAKNSHCSGVKPNRAKKPALLLPYGWEEFTR